MSSASDSLICESHVPSTKEKSASLHCSLKVLSFLRNCRDLANLLIDALELHRSMLRVVKKQAQLQREQCTAAHQEAAVRQEMAGMHSLHAALLSPEGAYKVTTTCKPWTRFQKLIETDSKITVGTDITAEIF